MSREERRVNVQKLRRLVIKEEIMVLTGDYELALMLNQFLYWSERVEDFDKFILEERKRAENEGMEVNIDFQNGWIYKDMEELKEEIMCRSSISTLSRKLNKLVEKGWLDRRKNPKYNWDKRYQYRVNLKKLALDLMDLGYVLQGYKFDLQETLKNANLQNENSNLHSASSNLQNENSRNCSINEDEQEETLKTPNLQNASSIFQNENSNLQNERALSIDYYNRLLNIVCDTHNINNNNNIYNKTTDKELLCVCNEIKTELGINISVDHIKKYIPKGLEYVREKMQIIKAGDFNNPTGAFKTALKEDWQPRILSPPKSKIKQITTGFHNFEQRSDNYTESDLENIASRKRDASG